MEREAGPRAPILACASAQMWCAVGSGRVSGSLGSSVPLRFWELFLQIQPKVLLFSPPDGSWVNRLNLFLFKSVSGFFHLQIINLTNTW